MTKEGRRIVPPAPMVYLDFLVFQTFFTASGAGVGSEVPVSP